LDFYTVEPGALPYKTFHILTPQYKHIKVFIMTTSAERADRDMTEQLGISGYIIKPLNYNDNNKRADSMDAFVEFHLRKILAEASGE
jgi:hypothetical protein